MLTCPVWFHFTTIQRLAWPVRYHPLRENIFAWCDPLRMNAKVPVCPCASVVDILPELPMLILAPMRLVTTCIHVLTAELAGDYRSDWVDGPERSSPVL